MTMTFEPFTPANGSDQGEYGGRRRAEERPEQHGRGRQTAPADRWAEPADPWDYQAPRDMGEWSDPGGVETSWADARPPDRGWPEQQGWREEPQSHQTSRQDQQTNWRDELSAAYPVQSMQEAAPLQDQRRRGFRAKPVILGVVVLLLLVAGWEAYRIESMSKHNAHLASVLTAEKTRTDRLEKQLAGVFDPEAVSSGVLPSVFRVRAGEFTGTAFSVGKGNGSDLLTNYHVVAEVWTSGGKSVSLERGSTKITATIVKVDKGKDLALLKAGQKIAGLAPAGGQVKPGQQVVVVGAPLGLDDTVTTGVISAYRPDDPDGATIQFDAPINPGNSGGPVVNADKQVVGLATAKAKDAEGIGLAIPIKTACETFDVC
jgi:putative serine protease PepD